MASALLASAQKEIVGSQSRDFTGLVKQVKDIFPQFSDDLVCDALVQSDEDVGRALELLMSAPFASRSGKKKEKKVREAQAAAEASPLQQDGRDRGASASGDWTEAQEAPAEPLREERPKTAAEKEAAKLKKKIREIERIEEKLARGEKVDPLQLPKIEKKSETEHELLVAERKVREEEAQRKEEEQRQLQEEQKRQKEEQQRRREEEQRLRQEADEARRRQEAEEEARLAREQAARLAQQREQEAKQRMQQTQQQASAQQWQAHEAQPPAQAQQLPDPQNMSMELLGLLHKNNGVADNRQHGYAQSRQVADQLAAGRGPVIQVNGKGGKGGKGGGYQRSQAPQYRPEQQAYHQQPKQQYQQQQSYHQTQQYKPDQQGWSQEERRNGGGSSRPQWKGEIGQFYTTPLDMSSIPAEKRAEAERIAKEIEQASGGGDGRRRDRDRDGEFNYAGGKGKGYGKGKGKGKSKSNDDWGPPGL